MHSNKCLLVANDFQKCIQKIQKNEYFLSHLLLYWWSLQHISTVRISSWSLANALVCVIGREWICWVEMLRATRCCIWQRWTATAGCAGEFLSAVVTRFCVKWMPRAAHHLIWPNVAVLWSKRTSFGQMNFGNSNFVLCWCFVSCCSQCFALQ